MISNLLILLWRPQGDLNPCCRRERQTVWFSNIFVNSQNVKNKQLPLKHRMKIVYHLCGFLHIFRRKVHICSTHKKKYLYNKYNLFSRTPDTHLIIRIQKRIQNAMRVMHPVTLLKKWVHFG